MLINEPYLIKPHFNPNTLTFAIPSYVKAQCRALNKDIIVLINNQTMKINSKDLDKPIKVYPTSHTIYHGGVYHNLEYQFVPDEKLSISEWDIKLLERFHYSWINKIPFIRTNEFRQIIIDVNKERNKFNVYPSKLEMFKAFEMDAHKVKVVILGKDPYPSNHANGLAFATKQENKPYALNQIQISLQKDFDTNNYLSNDLNGWVKQGVLLLNTAFTVRENDIGSHISHWKLFLKDILQGLINSENRIIWILLGGDAQKMKNKIMKSQRHIVLEAEHPSSSYYNGGSWDNNNVFKQCNEFLSDYYTEPIFWI